MVKHRKPKCHATVKKVGNHLSIKTTCPVSKMTRSVKKTGTRRKKPCKTRECKEKRRASAEIKRIMAKEYKLQT